MSRLTTLIVVLALAAGSWAQDEEKQKDAEKAGNARHPRLKMETTLGDIVLELDAEKAPVSTHNFIRYAEDGFYNDTIFHRVMSTFMIQGGGFTKEMDKKTEGLRPGITNEWKNGLKNVRGSIAMARMGGQPDSATSQFFINVVDNPRLDQAQQDGAAYTAFGKVVEGMDVVDKIRDAKVETNPKYPSPQPVTPVEPIIIKSVKLISAYDRDTVAAKVKALEEAAAAAAAAEKDAEQKALQEQIAKIEAEAGKKFTTTATGLLYLELEAGSGESPKPTDQVSVHYTGWLLDGKKFDSSRDRDQPATFPVNRVIPGWIEGLQLMKVGGKCKLLIPSALAYGKRGRPGIPPNSPLLFDIELLEIKK